MPGELAGIGGTPSQHASAREEFAIVEAAFDELSDDQRDIVMMSRLLGLSHTEIAQRTGKTEVAVRKSLSRGLARLAAVLAGETGDRDGDRD